ESVTSYGNPAAGKLLESEFGKEPFGWEFDMVKLLVLCLLRAGRIVATSQGRTIDSVQSDDTRTVFTNNPAFRAASFRPKKALDPTELVNAAENFKVAFGKEIPELAPDPVASAIRDALAEHEEPIAE